MDNISSSSFTNITNKLVNISKEVKARNVIYEVTFIINVIINSIACPLTVLLNVLVIMAVKRRPRLQSNTNILLACLAATDVFTGLVTQPLFLLDKMFEFLGMTKFETQFYFFWAFSLRVLTVCSCLHLTLVTCERLIAIKFTMRYPYLVTGRNIKVAVIAAWIFSLFNGTSRLINSDAMNAFAKFFVPPTIFSCVLFIFCSYLILYRETLRHQKKIKTQQLPQEEVERFAKESKALNTTVFVVGAVALCFVPVVFMHLFRSLGLFHDSDFATILTWVGTDAMLNSLFNPLINCWRQKEMRKFVFRFKTQAVHPAN
ncbi:alpha-1A adrenergic receptor-like [Oculina patagonica]